MNVPKNMQEAVFLAVCNSEPGAGLEQPWEKFEHTSHRFDAKGQYVRRGFVYPLDDIQVPFVATFVFGKPRRAKQEGAAK